MSRAYDANGRVATVSNPNGLVTQNIYNTRGYLTQIRNNATSALYWQVTAMDASGGITSQTHGNNVTTVRSFDNRSVGGSIPPLAPFSPKTPASLKTGTFASVMQAIECAACTVKTETGRSVSISSWQIGIGDELNWQQVMEPYINVVSAPDPKPVSHHMPGINR